MKIDKSIRSNTPSIDAYIEELESELTNFEASNIRRILQSIDLLAGKIAGDIEAVSRNESVGEGEERTMAEIDTKLVDSLVKLVEKADKFKAYNDVMKSMIPEVVNAPKTAVEEAKEAEAVVKLGENPFEEVMKKVKSRNRS